VLAERLHVVEAVGHVDGALGERHHLDLVMASEHEREEGGPSRDDPATHAAPPPGRGNRVPSTGAYQTLSRDVNGTSLRRRPPWGTTWGRPWAPRSPGGRPSRRRPPLGGCRARTR